MMVVINDGKEKATVKESLEENELANWLQRKICRCWLLPINQHRLQFSFLFPTANPQAAATILAAEEETLKEEEPLTQEKKPL